MAKPFFRLGVPNGSQLSICVSPEEGEVEWIASGFLRSPNGGEVEWDHDDLTRCEGPLLELQSPGRYSGQIDITYARESTAKLDFKVAKPDGTLFEQVDTAAGEPGRVDRTTLLFVMKRGG